MEVWSRLRADLMLAEHVHLQGWGEPLLHPDLAMMIDDAHAAGCEVGLTSNGDLLAAAAEWLVDSAIDRLAVSLAGVGSSHAELRAGSSAGDVLLGLARVAERRGSQPRPWLQVSYLLTRDNASDLPDLVVEAARAGADEVFVTHLDCTVSREQVATAAYSGKRLAPGVAELIDRAEQVAQRHKVRFRGPPIRAQELLVCALNPLQIVFVAWDGRVGPCVNQMLPVSMPFPRWTEQGCTQARGKCYGSLMESPLRQILDSEQYKRLQAPFRVRLAADQELRESPTGLWGGAALQSLDQADRRREQVLRQHRFPDQCLGCPKASGW
jgi:organic radical activating enzyme